MPRVKTKTVTGDSRLALGREIGTKLARLDKGDRELVLEIAMSLVVEIARANQTIKHVKQLKPLAAAKPAATRKALGASPLGKATAAVKAAVKTPTVKPVADKEEED